MEGPSIHWKKGNLVGYDERSTKKAGLDIFTLATKVQPFPDKPGIILVASEMVYNPGSNTTLISEYQVRNHGCVIDSVAKHHKKSVQGDKGTQTFYPKDDYPIPFVLKKGLMSFQLAEPTEEEMELLEHIQITSDAPWNPSTHADDDFPIKKTSHLLGDNMSVILNTTIPSSMLKKKHQGCAYHRVREAIAADILTFSYIPSEKNFADVLTKPLTIAGHHNLVRPWLFRRANVIDKAAEANQEAKEQKAENQELQVLSNMVRRIPTEEEQDRADEELRRSNYLTRFHNTLLPMTRSHVTNALSARNLRFNAGSIHPGVRGMSISIPDVDLRTDPHAWSIRVLYTQGHTEIMSLPLAREVDETRLAWTANYYGYSRMFEVWYWAADEKVLPLPNHTPREIRFEGRNVTRL